MPDTHLEKLPQDLTLHQPMCRFCGSTLENTFIDLGVSPLANTYLLFEDLSRMEPFYPLHAYVCGSCFLVQLEEFESPEEIFGDYVYFSSYSDSWLEHAKRYVDKVMASFDLNEKSRVVEIGSNDGYLLQYFLEYGVPVLGIEPARNVSQAAIRKDIPTLERFFSTETAQELVREGIHADLLIGNNVLAHVPQLNDFVQGLKVLLNKNGILTMEFPHLLCLMAENQFDTIYHEHFSYFSFLTVTQVFERHGLTVFNVEELSTHGGSLRIFARHSEDRSRPVESDVPDLLQKERAAGLDRLEVYSSFAQGVQEVKRHLLSFLIQAKDEGAVIAGYGAPAKGNTLLNYCGVRTDFLDYTVDRNPHKQGRYLPGTHIPIFGPEKIKQTKPDFLLILPWNLKEEIIDQMAFIREWGGQFVVPIPKVCLLR